MSDRDLSPQSDSPQPPGAGHYRADDDIELPPLAGDDSTAHAGTEWSGEQDAPAKPNSLASYLGGATIIAALAVGGWFAFAGSSAEVSHPNWRHVAAATESDQLIHLDSSGASQTRATMEVASADRDRGATRQVRAALRRGDVVTATAHLQAAQTLPGASQNPDVRPPELVADSELARAIQDGDQELFQIELFDCCDEDGDIVEVIVNGSHFATVPILHEGAKLSIPLARGSNSVTIRGVRDGGGGVTLSFRTSRGDYFARSMRVGQEHQMGVVVR